MSKRGVKIPPPASRVMPVAPPTRTGVLTPY